LDADVADVAVVAGVCWARAAQGASNAALQRPRLNAPRRVRIAGFPGAVFTGIPLAKFSYSSIA
jgi:hypothetical protein